MSHGMAFKKWEYKTTSGNVSSDPKQPDGIGWEMCGSAATNSFLFWFWKRINPEFEKAQMEKIAKFIR